MAPNSRPPLTSRIRASFEGRRKSFEGTRKLSKSGRTPTADSSRASQEVRSPTALDSEVNSTLHTNGFIMQDPDSIRNAVDQAFNGEAFQNAIAANLAKLIKPSIKSALDTIQPVVEAVYSHELLLHKMNQSVEDVLSRMDTNAETAAVKRESQVHPTYVALGTPADGEKSADAVEGAVVSKEVCGPIFDQFKQLMEEYNTKILATISESMGLDSTKIAQLAQEVSDIKASIEHMKESIDSLKSSSDKATTTSSVLQAQLDQLKGDTGQIIGAIGTDLGKNIQAISEKFGAPDAELLSSHTAKLDLISTDLAALKGHEETVAMIGSISSELGALKTSVEAGNTANGEGSANVLVAIGEALVALQQSNDSHAIHTINLSEIKERSLSSAPGGNVDHSTALQTIQTDLTALKENTAVGLASNSDLGVKIDTVLTTIEEHQTGDYSVELLTAVKHSNESQAAYAAALKCLKSSGVELGTQVAGIVGKLDEHSSALEDIKAFVGTHTAAFESIKSTAPEGAPPNTSELSAQVAAISAKLDTYSEVLDEIKGLGFTSTKSTLADHSDLTAQIGTIVTKLDTHSATLDEIKGLSGTHATALESHGTSLESIKSAAPESPLVDTPDLITQISAIVSKIDEQTTSLDEIKGIGDSHTTALGTALEGIKSLNVVAHESGVHAAIETQIAAVVATLERHGAALDEIKTHGTTIESHGSALEYIKTCASAQAIALESHGVTLDGIKSLIVSPPTEGGNSELKARIAAIVTTLESHGAALDEIKTSAGAHVTALETHGTTLESLKSLTASSPAEADDVKIGAIITALESHSAALNEITATSGSHSSVLDEIKSIGTAHATALDSYGTVLENIKSRSVEPALGELVTKLESHSAALEEIKASTESHSLALKEINLASNIHADALEDVRSFVIPAIPAADPGNLAALEIQIGSIMSTLETHSAAWNEIKSRNDPASTVVAPADSVSASESPEGPFTTIIETLMLHTKTLNEIKEDVSAEILTALHDMSQVQANQTNILIEIREADLDDEILTLLHASGDSHSRHSSALDKIHAAVLVSNESHTAHSSSLDEIKSRSLEPVASSGVAADSGVLKERINSIAEKLEEYSLALSAIKNDTAASNYSHAAHATSLNEIKSRFVDTLVAGVSNAALEAQISGIVTKLDDHTSVLSFMKDATAVSNESNAAHATILRGIRDAALASNESHTAHAATLADIKDWAASSSESHAAHVVVLSEMKDATLASTVLHSALATSLSQLKEATICFNDNHAATLSEIKDATLASKDAHGSHIAALTELKSMQPIAASVPESTDLSVLEAQITSILKTLEGQTAILSSVQECTAAATPEILAAIQASHDIISSHGPSLEAIKEGVSHADVLSIITELKTILEDSKADIATNGALVKVLHAETKDSHSDLASAIGALAVGGTAGAGATALLTKDDHSSSAVLDEVKAVRALVETSAASIEDTKDKVSTIANHIETNHTTITNSISALGDEVKSEIDASGTGIIESMNDIDACVKAIGFSSLPTLSSSLKQHGADIRSLSTQLQTLEGNVKENTTHITTLHNGVHLNKTGVEQLKDHVVSLSIVPAQALMSVTEGASLGSARSGSRIPTLSSVVSRSFVEPAPEDVEEVAVAESSPGPAEEALQSTEETVAEFVTEPAEDRLPSTEEAIADPDPKPEPTPASEAVEEVLPSTEELVAASETESEEPSAAKEFEYLSKAEENFQAHSRHEQPIEVEEHVAEFFAESEIFPGPIDDLKLSTEEPAMEPNVNEINETATGAELSEEAEVAEAIAQPDEPSTINERVAEPGTVLEVLDGGQASVEEPVLRPETSRDDQPEIKDVKTPEISLNLWKDEEDICVEPTTVIEEFGVVDDAHSSIEEALVDPETECPVEEQSVWKDLEGDEDSPNNDDVVETAALPEEPSTIDNSFGPSTVAEGQSDAQEIDQPEISQDYLSAKETTNTTLLPEDLAFFDVPPSTGETVVDAEVWNEVETVNKDVDLPEDLPSFGELSTASSPPAPHLCIDDRVFEPESMPDMDGLKVDTLHEPFSIDNVIVERGLLNDIPRPFEKGLDPDLQSEDPLVAKSPPTENDGAKKAPIDLAAPTEISLATDHQVACDPATKERSASIDEASAHEELDLLEGSSVVEREIQSGEASITDGPAFEIGEEHTSTILETRSPDEAAAAKSLENEPEPTQTNASESLHEEDQVDFLVAPFATHSPNEFDADLSIVTPGSTIQPAQYNDLALFSSAQERGSLPELQTSSSPLSTHEAVQSSSPFIESPNISRNLDGLFAGSPLGNASLIPPARQNFLWDRGLDLEHAAHRDETRSNPFVDSDKMITPSVFAPQSVLSSEAEIDAPVFSVPDRNDYIHESGFRSPESNTFAPPPPPPPTFPVFPVTGNGSVARRRVEDSDDVFSPGYEYDAPVYSNTRQTIPVPPVEHDNFRSLEFDTSPPPPAVPVFPGTTETHLQQRFEYSDDLISPSSEYDAPVFSDTRPRTHMEDQPFDSPAFTPAPLSPVLPGTSQYATQPPSDESEDPMSPASGYDVHALPHMSPESPIQSRPFETSRLSSSPQFQHQSALQSRGLQREGSSDHEQDNYAMLPRNLGGRSPNRSFEYDDFRSPRGDEFVSSDIGQISPLRPLGDDDYRGQHERCSPEPGFSDLRRRSPVQDQPFDDVQGNLPPHLQLASSTPDARQRSPIRPFEDDEYQSHRDQQYSPEHESQLSGRRQYSLPPPLSSHGSLPPHRRLDTAVFRSTSPIDPYGERESEIVSPSSELAAPITPALPTHPTEYTFNNPFYKKLTAATSHNPVYKESSIEPEADATDFPASSGKGRNNGKAIAPPDLMSPDLGSSAEFAFSRGKTETETESTLASPTSPVFSEGGTMIEKSSGKKNRGRNEKKEKGGGEKDNVPSQVDRDDLE